MSSVFTTNQVAISAAPAKVAIPPGSYNLVLSNVGPSAATCYVGNSNVTTATGLAIAAGATVVIPVAAGSTPGLYVVGTAGTLSWMAAA